uniref:Kinesin motor domain-containing protein n=1 Tax=Amphilophus citrinellus TaxID=61819 RepID=A0A3Q0RS27_AMPCI
MAEESAVRVCVRVRPLISCGNGSVYNNLSPLLTDRVFTADETTSQLYNDIAKPLVVSTVEGYNGTIFAYGQTSSGKTFTMMGSERTPGVIPLAVEDVFQTIKNVSTVKVSYMEIYNETVTDLLVDSWKRKPLEVREQINVSGPFRWLDSDQSLKASFFRAALDLTDRIKND